MWGIVVDITEEFKPLLRVSDGSFIERMMVNARGRTGNFPVVGCGVEIQDSETSLEEIDAGDEGLALEAVFIQVVRMAI